MTDVRHLFYCLSLLIMLTACGSGSDLTETPDTLVPGGGGTSAPDAISLAFSVSSTTDQQTRSGADIIQQTGFRGLTDLRFISFQVQREVQKDDVASNATVGDATQKDGTVNDKAAKFFFYQNCDLPLGTASLLVYAKAAAIENKGNKAQNGSTQSDYASLAPSGITFSPERIFTGSVTSSAGGDKTDAEKIADYLTAIANSAGWAASTDPQLQPYYLNFIGEGSITPTVIAGSAASVTAWVNKLKELITALDYQTGSDEAEVKTAILGNIGTGLPSTISATYPRNNGLPDGAAALSWNDTDKKFVPVASTTMDPNINDITSFVYPAELCYYGNSQICTSTTAYDLSSWTSKNWGTSPQDAGTVLENYKIDPGIVNTATKAVAVKKPIQYGVARLDAIIKAKSSPLKDAQNVNVTVGSASFPLTGIIVGGQRQVGFDFTAKAEGTPYLAYDSYVMTDDNATAYLSTTEQPPVHTLLLQSKDGEDEMVILEFENNSDTDFAGINGTIYRETKFYLIGMIGKPTPDASKDYTKRVFTQDYKTTVYITVESLTKAYNIVPNLLSPRLEIGVQLETKWEQAPPTNLPLL